MFYINYLKQILSNEIILIIFIISYSLTFKTSRQLKHNGFTRDYKIVKVTGIIYGVLAIAATIIIII